MKWELHAHTAHSSHCGRVEPAEVARVHAAAGYAGMVVSDHYNRENLECFPGTPIEQTREWLKGYEAVRAEGERLGLRVLFGLEVRLQDCDNDYLILGAEPSLVLEKPLLHFLTIEQMYELCHEYGALLVQAHPNRKNCHLADPETLDGVEGYNGNPRHDNHNDLTLKQAAEHPHLIVTSGSDYHRPEDLDRGGIETDADIRTSADLACCLRQRRFRCIAQEG